MVGFLIMMGMEMIEGLLGGARVRVEGYSIVSCAKKVLQDM
jgi:hypothetical protein